MRNGWLPTRPIRLRETKSTSERINQWPSIYPIPEMDMSLMSKLFAWKSVEPASRIRICRQCGMPVGEHKEWCTILRAQQPQRPAEAVAND